MIKCRQSIKVLAISKEESVWICPAVRLSISKMNPNFLSVCLVIFSLVATSLACCCTYMSSCNCNIFGCDCLTHDGGWCYYYDSNDYCQSYNHERCNAYTTMQYFSDWDMNKDGMISAVEALEYGNLTLPEFLKADKDQNGFVVPSEFDSDLADE